VLDALYGFADGGVAGGLFAWIYNNLAGYC
jgi:hypothetical protein